MGKLNLILKALIVTILLGIIIATPVISSLTDTVAIRSSGQILARYIVARSGSPEDIQAAVDAIAAAGGGTVYVPEGNWTFNVDPNKLCAENSPVGVIIPGGVNVIGAGKDKTILTMTVEPPSRATMFYIDGYNGKPSRVSGFTFVGYVKTTEEASIGGVGVLRSKDFRVDHCKFIDFSGGGMGVADHLYNPHGYCRGVIDHCDFDQPYKDNLNIPDRLWGYGIVIVATYYNWESNINNLLGHYDDITHVVYIEDCTFRRCRHAIAANGGAHYVARHNYFTEMIISYYGSYIDAHGGSGVYPPAVGTRCVEIYNNIIEDSPTDYRSIDNPAYWGRYLGLGIGIRGGGGVIFNNTIKYCANGIRLYSDTSYEVLKPHDIWIWGNTFVNVSNPFEAWQSPISITENVDYFLYAKSGYTPYTYPHPLTLG